MLRFVVIASVLNTACLFAQEPPPKAETSDKESKAKKVTDILRTSPGVARELDKILRGGKASAGKCKALFAWMSALPEENPQ